MRKFFPLLIAVSALLLLSSCGGQPQSTISTDGSTSMERVLGALIEGYRTVNDSVTINYSGTGSGAGIEAVLSGVCDIGLSSRPLKESEIRKGAEAHLIALDGIAIIVHPSNPISSLSLPDLAAIFTGNLTNWSQLGGHNAPFAVYGREAGSGTRTAFEEITDTVDQCRYTNEYSSTGDIVGNVASNPNGIGYVSLPSVSSSVRSMPIDGVPCTEDTIRNGYYPIQRPFLMITSTTGTLSHEAQQFLTYATSKEAAELIAIAGAVAPQEELSP